MQTLCPRFLLCYVDKFRAGSMPTAEELAEAEKMSMNKNWDDWRAVAIVEAWHRHCFEGWRRSHPKQAYPPLGWLLPKVWDHLDAGTLPGESKG